MWSNSNKDTESRSPCPLPDNIQYTEITQFSQLISVSIALNNANLMEKNTYAHTLTQAINIDRWNYWFVRLKTLWKVSFNNRYREANKPTYRSELPTKTEPIHQPTNACFFLFPFWWYDCFFFFFTALSIGFSLSHLFPLFALNFHHF